MSRIQTLVQCVHYHLDNDLNENALFLSERLHAQDPDNSSWAHLMSLCCLRLGRLALASEYSRDKGIKGIHLGCSYIFAEACLRQKTYADGIKALIQAQPLWSGKGQGDEQSHSERFLPDSSSVNRLLGRLYKANGDTKTAVKHYVAALEENPFMWDAFTDLCDCGISLNLPNIFKLKPSVPIEMLAHGKATKLKESQVKTNHPSSTSSLHRPEQPSNPITRAFSQQDPYLLADHHPVDNENNATVTGSKNIRTASGNVPMTDFDVNMPSKKRRRSPANINTVGEISRKENNISLVGSMSSAFLAPQRRSARLVGRNKSSKALTDYSSIQVGPADDALKRRKPSRPNRLKTSASRQAPSAIPLPGSTASRNSKTAASTSSITKMGRVSHLNMTALVEEEKLHSLVGLFLTLGTAYYHLSQFRPHPCLQTLLSLPAEQQVSPWVISKTGRAQYELLSYAEAKSTFQVLRKTAPSWIEDLEIFSTVLWHLKEDVELAFLAHELTDNHFLSPQAWCAVGNSFSLQNSSKEAMKCFRRATQLQPQLAHSYSLLGHEYYAAEEYDEASAAFRRALQVDSRHYTAWVGLGRVQEKLGRRDAALKHYLSAEKLNPHNMVLLTYIARVLDKSGEPSSALGYLRRASELGSPRTDVSFIKLQTTSLLLRLGRPAEALWDLRLLEKSASNEPHVHFLLGRAYLMLGQENRAAALSAFTIAHSLDPTNQNIKEAITLLNGGG
ncbi:TPR-like protein [Xylaria sp. FL1777]|nr:TPR-like protein [Xylaria sp. FL1777]